MAGFTWNVAHRAISGVLALALAGCSSSLGVGGAFVRELGDDLSVLGDTGLDAAVMYLCEHARRGSLKRRFTTMDQVYALEVVCRAGTFGPVQVPAVEGKQ